MVGTIACFLTCGYTEAGGMQFFLRKMNNKYNFKQFLPNKTIKKKGTAKTLDHDINGLTGEDLLEKIYSIISKHKKEIIQCKAILIEDDLDGKFHGYSDEQIKVYTRDIINNIYQKLEAVIPVFLLYASPEVESWFLADWKNGFEYLYCDSDIIKGLSKNVKSFFCHHLKKYIDENILKEYVDDIENYGWFGEKYFKLSDEIIDAVQLGVKEEIQKLSDINLDYVTQIVESKELYYSKKLYGDKMLKNIQPQIVAERCKTYFGYTYSEICNF